MSRLQRHRPVAALGDALEGVRPAPARPHDARHDARHSRHPAGPLRLRDPDRGAAPADGGARRVAHAPRAAAWSRCSRNSGNFDIVEHVPDRADARPADRDRAGQRGARDPARASCATSSAAAAAEAQVIVDAADPLASSAALSGARPGRHRAGRRHRPGRRRRTSRARASACGPGTTRGSGAPSTSCPGIIGRAAVADAGAHHEHGGGARAGARHAGAAHRHADRQDQPDAGQDPAVPAHRLRADHGHPRAGPAAVPRADARAASRCSTC